MGIAGRSQSDPQTLQKRDYLLAFSAVLDSDLEKAAHFLESEHIDNYLRTEPSILVIAAKVHHGLGDERKAGELLLMAKQKNAELQAISEQVMNDALIFTGGERLGLNHEQAISINETGTQLFIEGNKDDVWHPADDGSSNWNMVSLENPADSALNMAPFPSASFSDLPLVPVDNLWPNIKNKVGAISPQRDDVDAQVVADVDARTGSVIDTTFNVWPEYPPGVAQSDLDGDGMWDSFELLHGSNPEVPDAFEEDGEFELWQYFSHYALYGELYEEEEF